MAMGSGFFGFGAVYGFRVRSGNAMRGGSEGGERQETFRSRTSWATTLAFAAADVAVLVLLPTLFVAPRYLSVGLASLYAAIAATGPGFGWPLVLVAAALVGLRIGSVGGAAAGLVVAGVGLAVVLPSATMRALVRLLDFGRNLLPEVPPHDLFEGLRRVAEFLARAPLVGGATVTLRDSEYGLHREVATLGKREGGRLVVVGCGRYDDFEVEVGIRLPKVSRLVPSLGKVYSSVVGHSVRILVEKGELYRLRHRLETRDPLTGLLKLEVAIEVVDRMIDATSRRSWPICVALLDIDGLAAINEEQGREKGDELLRTVARKVRRSIRSDDVVARCDDASMLVVLENTGFEAAAMVMERVRMTIEKETIATISVGVIEREDGENSWEAIGRARSALLQAKGAGGNRVVALAAMPEAPASIE
jgi:diguanylate cyclase (GGDEF)-like protein